MKKTIIIFSITLLLSLTGCMSFNNKKLPKVQNPIPVYRPIINIKVGDYNLKLNNKTSDNEIISKEKNGNIILNTVTQYLISRNLIDSYNKIDNQPDFTLILDGCRDTETSWIWTILCGITLFIIPNSETVNYNLDFKLINNHTKEEYKCNIENSTTLWYEIIFLPTVPFFWIGIGNMWADTAMYVYNDFYKQGAFKEFYKNPYDK